MRHLDNVRGPGRNPVGVAINLNDVSPGSSFLATLGFEMESLWDTQMRSEGLEYLCTTVVVYSAILRKARGQRSEILRRVLFKARLIHENEIVALAVFLGSGRIGAPLFQSRHLPRQV